jgi:hypothetical protein
MCRCAVENELERLCGAVCGVRWVSDGERVEFKIECEKNELRVLKKDDRER